MEATTWPARFARCRRARARPLKVLARRAVRLALRTAGVLTGSRQEADDISQEVAVDVLASIGKLRDPAAFDAWVHRITVRRTMKLLRKRRLNGDRQMPLALVPEAGAAGDEGELIALRQRSALPWRSCRTSSGCQPSALCP